jgi:hypothetical protein
LSQLLFFNLYIFKASSKAGEWEPKEIPVSFVPSPQLVFWQTGAAVKVERSEPQG